MRMLAGQMTCNIVEVCDPQKGWIPSSREKGLTHTRTPRLFQTNMKCLWKSDSLTSIGQSGIDFEWFWVFSWRIGYVDPEEQYPSFHWDLNSKGINLWSRSPWSFHVSPTQSANCPRVGEVWMLPPAATPEVKHWTTWCRGLTAWCPKGLPPGRILYCKIPLQSQTFVLPAQSFSSWLVINCMQHFLVLSDASEATLRHWGNIYKQYRLYICLREGHHFVLYVLNGTLAQTA